MCKESFYLKSQAWAIFFGIPLLSSQDLFGVNGQIRQGEWQVPPKFTRENNCKAIPSIIYFLHYLSIQKPNRQADKKKV